MAKQEAPLQALSSFLPPGSFDMVVPYLHEYHVHLTITRERKSILGDYRHALTDKNHRISVNGNLNPYAFLVTLLHELAHLLTFIQYGNRVASHGKEWKEVYGRILHQFTEKNIFPEDIRLVLQQSMRNPAASSCAEDGLIRVLRKYDTGKHGGKLIEELETGKLFVTPDGRIFRRGQKVRKRYQCVEVATKKVYLFSPVYEVEELKE